MQKINTCVLVSGGGTNLQALLDYQASNLACPYRVCVVISDRKSAFALQRALKANVPTKIFSAKSVLEENYPTATREQKQEAVSNAILTECKDKQVQIIVLAGFLTVLSGKIIQEYRNRILNLHPALLPKFSGVGMWGHHVHEAVLQAGEKESGCTIHLVDSGCDTGKILLQKRVPVYKDDTPDTLASRIAPQEHKAIVEGVCMLSRSLETNSPL